MADAISVKGLERVIRTSPRSRCAFYSRIASRSASRSVSSTQSMPERPAADDVARPVDAEHHAAECRSAATGTIAPQTAVRCHRVSAVSSERERQVEDHRAGRMAAREGRRLHDDEMRLEIGARTRAIQYF